MKKRFLLIAAVASLLGVSVAQAAESVLEQVHRYAAWFLMLMVLGHALAALRHHFVSLLRRVTTTSAIER
jgi:cytochrome b561